MKIKAIILGLFAMTIAFAGQAQTTPKVANRQVNQQERIRSGYKSGALTKKETAKLQAQQAHIQRSKKRAKADGRVTAKERAMLHRKQNRANKNIYRQKHDSQSRK
ncbi:MAG: hypothetical protein AAF990_21990 [Bacteroidota bacterium]